MGKESSTASRGRRAKRPSDTWHAFNDWWRAVYIERGHKKPTVSQVVEWYDEFAESVWVDSDSRPTLEDTKAHSKGVRTTEGARMYSRQYRALQKAVQGLVALEDDDVELGPESPLASPTAAKAAVSSSLRKVLIQRVAAKRSIKHKSTASGLGRSISMPDYDDEEPAPSSLRLLPTPQPTGSASGSCSLGATMQSSNADADGHTALGGISISTVPSTASSMSLDPLSMSLSAASSFAFAAAAMRAAIHLGHAHLPGGTLLPLPLLPLASSLSLPTPMPQLPIAPLSLPIIPLSIPPLLNAAGEDICAGLTAAGASGVGTGLCIDPFPFSPAQNIEFKFEPLSMA